MFCIYSGTINIFDDFGFTSSFIYFCFRSRESQGPQGLVNDLRMRRQMNIIPKSVTKSDNKKSVKWDFLDQPGLKEGNKSSVSDEQWAACEQGVSNEMTRWFWENNLHSHLK